MWEILAAQDLWSELSSNVSYYCMNELRGWNGSLIQEIKHTCNHSRGAQLLIPAPLLEFDSAATRSWIISNSWTWNKLAAAQIYTRKPGIHAREESVPWHGAAAENQFSSRTSPPTKTNTHGCSRAHSVRQIGAARSHCLPSSWMRIAAVAQAAKGKPQESIHPSIIE